MKHARAMHVRADRANLRGDESINNRCRGLGRNATPLPRCPRPPECRVTLRPGVAQEAGAVDTAYEQDDDEP